MTDRTDSPGEASDADDESASGGVEGLRRRTSDVLGPPTARPNGRRFVAGVLDWIILVLLATAVTSVWHETVLVVSYGKTRDQIAPTVGALWLTLGLISAYWIVGHGRFGQSAGKAVVGLRVVTEDGEPVGYGRAAARYLVTTIGWVVAWIAPRSWTDVTAALPTLWPLVVYVPILVDREGRGLHDRIAGTKVVATATRLPSWLSRNVAP